MGETWDDNEFPLAYLITIRTFGTWFHGDERKSVDRHGKNVYGTERIPANSTLQNKMSANINDPPFLFDKIQQASSENTIKEVCYSRGYFLHAINVRTNHIHIVVSAQTTPEKIISAFKSYTTRNLRKEKLTDIKTRVWSRGGSRRYLWKKRHVDLAIDYVLYCQDDVVFNIYEEELHTR